MMTKTMRGGTPPRGGDADSDPALERQRLRWEEIERRAAASGDHARLSNAQSVLRRLGRLDR